MKYKILSLSLMLLYSGILFAGLTPLAQEDFDIIESGLEEFYYSTDEDAIGLLPFTAHELQELQKKKCLLIARIHSFDLNFDRFWTFENKDDAEKLRKENAMIKNKIAVEFYKLEEPWRYGLYETINKK